MCQMLKRRLIVGVVTSIAALITCSLVMGGSNLRASAAPFTSPDGWEWQNPLPQGNTLFGVWGTSSSNVFAVGEYGTIMHYDGSEWTSMSSGTTNTLTDVWGSSAANVFAVGRYGVVLHYDGSSWNPMPSGTTSNLIDVWGSSSSNVFAVGYEGTIVHYDGSVWSPMTSGTTDYLKGIWGSSASDIFAVGSLGAALHYDADSWTVIDPGQNAFPGGDITYNYSDIWVSSSSDLLIVGCQAPPHLRGCVWHNGSATTFDSSSFLEAVWGFSSSDVFAVGEQGSILRYDGCGWASMTTGTVHTLLGIWGSSSSDVFAVGGNGTILHFDGSNWVSMTGGARSFLLVDVWGTSSSDVFAVGCDPACLHYDGTTWTMLPTGGLYFITDVWGTSSSNVFALAGWTSTGGIVHWDGAAWSPWNPMPDPSPSAFQGIWGTSPSDFYVCRDSEVLHYNGSAWSTATTGTSHHLYAIWGSYSSDVLAVGSGGAIYHYDGSSWTPMTSNTTGNLLDVWGTSSSDVFAVGQDGIILHYDGIEWSHMNSGTSSTLNNVWSSSPTDVYAVGTNGTIVHYDGVAWSSMSSGTTRELDGVWGTPSSDVFAVGSEGTILHYTGSSNTAPNQPANVSPANGAPGVSLTPSLRSTGFSDPDAGDTHAASQWQIRPATGDYSSPAFDSGIDTTHPAEIQVPLGALAYSTTYYWRVRYEDNRGAWSDWSCETSFTTPPLPQAQFDFTCVRVSRAVMLVFFSNLSSGGVAPLTYAWDFDSDGTVDATEREPWHRYMASGTYTVSLTITDAVGNTHTETKADCITVLSPGRGKHGNGGRADQRGFRHWRLLAQWSAFRSPIARPCPPGPSLPCGG